MDNNRNPFHNQASSAQPFGTSPYNQAPGRATTVGGVTFGGGAPENRTSGYTPAGYTGTGTNFPGASSTVAQNGTLPPVVNSSANFTNPFAGTPNPSVPTSARTMTPSSNAQTLATSAGALGAEAPTGTQPMTAPASPAFDPTYATTNVSSVVAPASKMAPKFDNKSLILMVCLAIVACIGVGLGIFGLIQSSNKDAELTAKNATLQKVAANLGTSVNSVVSGSANRVNLEADYTNLMSTIEDNLVGSGVSASLEQGVMPFFVPEGLNTAVPLKLAKTWRTTGLIDENGNSPFISALESAGFTAYEPLANWYGTRQFYNADINTICATSSVNVGETSYVDLTCGNAGWTLVSSEDLAFYRALSDAFYAVNNSYPAVIVGTPVISPSSVEPFEAVTVNLGDGSGLFYRVDNNSDWVYFASLQAELPCSAFAADEHKKAFAGMSCYDEAAGTSTTVTP